MAVELTRLAASGYRNCMPNITHLSKRVTSADPATPSVDDARAFRLAFGRHVRQSPVVGSFKVDRAARKLPNVLGSLLAP